MLLHADFIHIGFNSYALWIYGPILEATLGKMRFLAIYIVAGFTGNVASYAFGRCPSFGLGASGAIFGAIGALLVFHFVRRKTSAAGRAGLQGILFIIVINLAIGFSSQGIDNFAHMGGLAGGILIGTGFDRAERLRTTGKIPASAAAAIQVAVAFAVAAAGIFLAVYKTTHFTCFGL